MPVGLFPVPMLDRVGGKIKRGFVVQTIGDEREYLKQLVTQATHDFRGRVGHF